MKNQTFKAFSADRRRRRRRGAARLFVLGAAFVTSTAFSGTAHAQARRPAAPTVTSPGAGPAASAQSTAIRFDIPAGTIGAAMTRFAAATGITVTFASDMLRDLPAPALSGLLTPTDALDRLLAGTGVGFTFQSANAVHLDIRSAEFVEVSGRGQAVASPKFTEPILDIPQTINVIPQSVISEQGATTLRDVLRNVVGITFQAGEGGVPAGDQLTIRGFSARTDMFIDGVRDFGGYSRDSFNLEQVEVAKGPSSAIAGRGSTGGAINQVSKAPHRGRSYAFSAGGGNADYRRMTADLNQPIGDGIALRVNAMWTDAGVPRRDVVNNGRWGAAPSLAFGLDSPVVVTASHLHLAQDGVPEYGLPWVPANINPALAAYANGQPPVDASNFYGLATRDYEKTTTDVSTAQVDVQLRDGLSLRNLTRYGRNERDSVITAPRFVSVNTSTAINRQLQSRDMVDTIAANQTTATARFRTGRVAHAVSTGIEVAHETSENFARSGPAATPADLFEPNPFEPYPGPITRTGAKTLGTASSIAAYAFDTVKPSERFELTGGLRWDRFAVDTDSLAVTGISTPFERVDRMVSWRAGAVYKPRPSGSVYAGVSTALNPSAEGLALTVATVSLDPERTRNFEAGTKWDLMGGQFSASAGAFRTEKTNARTPGINPGDPPTVLAGKQSVNGIELGLSGRPTRRLSVLSGYAFMRSRIESSNTAAELDNALALTPAHTLSLWTTYDVSERASIGGGAQYMDAVFRNATNTAAVPSYWLFNALASYEVNEQLTLRVNGQNLADRHYVDRVGGGHYIPGPGRQVTLTAGVTF